jgi:hypothetical protein
MAAIPDVLQCRRHPRRRDRPEVVVSLPAHSPQLPRTATGEGATRAAGGSPSGWKCLLGTVLVILSSAAVTFAVAAPAAADTAANPTCDAAQYGSNGATAACARLAYGESVRVKITCSDAGRMYTRYGDWVSSPYVDSLKYCDLRAHAIHNWQPDVVISTR